MNRKQYEQIKKKEAMRQKAIKIIAIITIVFAAIWLVGLVTAIVLVENNIIDVRPEIAASGTLIVLMFFILAWYEKNRSK